MLRLRTLRSAAVAAFLALVVACGGGGGNDNDPDPADWYVNAITGSDANNGNFVAPFKTITKALSLAILGQTIAVSPGTYDAANGEVFPMLIGPGVTLIGDEPNKGVGVVPTAIVGGGLVPLPNPSGDLFATIVPGAGSLIAGLSITDDVVAGLGAAPHGIVFSNASVIVLNCTVQGCSDSGLYFHNFVGNHLILENVIQANVASGLWFDPDAGADTRVEGNAITGNGTGVAIDVASADLGGGATGSLGGNTLSCNSEADLWCAVPITIEAQDNFWDHNPPTTTWVLLGDDIKNLGGATIVTTGSAVAASPCP